MVDTTLTCPVDGCDYSGAIESVKNHITAKMDAAHEGKKGEDVVYEAQADEQADSRDDGPDEVESEGVDEGDDGAASGAAEQGSDDSLVWYVGAGLVALFLWLTGRNDSRGEQGQTGPEVV